MYVADIAMTDPRAARRGIAEFTVNLHVLSLMSDLYLRQLLGDASNHLVAHAQRQVDRRGVALRKIIRARLLRDFVERGWARMNIRRAADAPETS